MAVPLVAVGYVLEQKYNRHVSTRHEWSRSWGGDRSILIVLSTRWTAQHVEVMRNSSSQQEIGAVGVVLNLEDHLLSCR